jgi:predicted MPP superfamily phosphohydrolase
VAQIKRTFTGLGALALAAAAHRALWAEPRSLAVTRLHVEVPGWAQAGLRIGVLSDLHAGAPHASLERVQQVADVIDAERPDLLALLGDYVDPRVAFAREVAPESVARILGGIQAPLGAFAVLGNHDWREGGPRIRAALEAEGIAVLENDSRALESGLHVVGLADPSERKPDLVRAYVRLPVDAVPLVLSHDPDLFPRLPPRAQLVLSGHTHGGQVDLPGVSPAAWTPSAFGALFTGGKVQAMGPKRLWVSRGVGTSRFPIRFGARPEVAVLTVAAGISAAGEG